MLSNLQIENIAVIKSASIDFSILSESTFTQL